MCHNTFVNQGGAMDSFDDLQIEDSYDFEFGEASFSDIFEEEDNDDYYKARINSNYEI